METKEELEKKKNELENKKVELRYEIKKIEEEINNLEYKYKLLQYGEKVSCANCKYCAVVKYCCSCYMGFDTNTDGENDFCYFYEPDNQLTEFVKKNSADGKISAEKYHAIKALGVDILEEPLLEREQEEKLKTLQTISSII